ncbi:MAG: hypothetical protein GC191_18540 [Azospirillum sp.]|nr:hypothetical protein [Azospirillum sp.]
MINLNHGSGYRLPTIADAINGLVDMALVTERASQPPRRYLGASALGIACARALQFDYTATPKDPGRDFGGGILRIFAAGHRFEDLSIRWLRAAGFDLRTHRRDGGQFGFSAAGGRIQGHIDGVVVAAPPGVGMAVPALWEHKALNHKSWQDTVKRSVAVSKPVYAGQIAIYQGYLDLPAPALFTALNKDTCELHHELVPFDGALAQRLSDRAVTVLRATDAGELLARHSTNRDHPECRRCAWQDRCWRMP